MPDKFPYEPGGSGSGGGPAPPARVAPDDHDVVVLYNYPGGSSWNNSGSGGSLVFTCAGYAGPWPCLGVFGEGALWQEPQLQTDKGGIAFSTATSVGEGQTLALHSWVYCRSAPSAGSAPFAVFGKTYLGGSGEGVGWAPPYSPLTLYLFQGAVGIDVLAQVTLVGGTQPVIQAVGGIVDFPAPHHVALVVTPGEMRLLVDGALAATEPLAYDIDWLSHGGWFVGGIPTGGGSSRAYSPGPIGDFRVRDEDPGDAYFASVWAGRRTP